MHTTLRYIWILPTVLLLTACGNVGDAPEAQTGEAVTVAESEGEALPIDTTQSAINWRAAKVTRAHDGGFNMFTGTVSVADNNVTGIDVAIDTRSIWSDTERLTGHLMSADFFDVETYPEAQFQADQITPVDSAGATHLVTGNLTMHGQTHAVTFPASITVADNTVQATADFIINRTNWGINYTGAADDLIENDVRLILNVSAAAPTMTAEAEADA